MNRHLNVQPERYAAAERMVAGRGETKQIADTDLADLDHSGRCKVTNVHWHLGNASARNGLINVPRFVDACARVQEIS